MSERSPTFAFDRIAGLFSTICDREGCYLSDITLNNLLKQIEEAPALAELDAASKARHQRSSVQPRRMVFAILKEAKSPLGAYEILKRMSAQTGRKIAPPTVYRAFDFLTDRHLVSRIETKNAFVCVASGGSRHSHAFFICGVCGYSTQTNNRTVEQLLVDDATAIGFAINKAVIELRGTCASCRLASSLAPSG